MYTIFVASSRNKVNLKKSDVHLANLRVDYNK